MRLAFVGQRTFFEACALADGRVPGVATTFVDFRKDADPAPLRRALDAFAPDVLVVFRPEIVPAGTLDGLEALRLGFLTEPLPRRGDGSVPHEDLDRRLWELGQLDAASFDRVVSFDPLITASADAVLPVWRSVPLPVADRFYRTAPRPLPTPRADAARALFVGRSTPHREEMLVLAKHHHDVLHMAFGVDADELDRLMGEHAVGINLHNNPYPSFENRVPLHLAAANLVVSEPLSPTHGLEPGIDFLQVTTPHELELVLASLARWPGHWHAIRARGRRKAEAFRASRVWPRVVGDLAADVRAFGRRVRG